MADGDRGVKMATEAKSASHGVAVTTHCEETR